MAIIPQPKLFSWEDLQPLGDLERLQLVLETIPDESLMRILEHDRGRGRNDYPIRAMWNSVLAGIVFQHPTIESLRRELNRNGQLREMVGLGSVAPSAWAYTRFLHRILEHLEDLDTMIHHVIDDLQQVLPDFGERLAIDSKAIESFAKRRSDDTTPDGRRDTDADWGKKTYRGVDAKGKVWEKVTAWFGYKIHLLVDATYELPVAWTVTKASTADITEAPKLLAQLQSKHPLALQAARVLTGDRGYDDTKLVRSLWDDYGIKPIIDIRNMWKDGDPTRMLPGHDTVTYNYRGDVFCHHPETGAVHRMANGGFEADRDTLKKRCPAKFAGITCEAQDTCPVAQGIRISLETDRRVFTPMDRSSYAWEREYAHRTAVERVNSRLDVSFGFELHTIRGMTKMRARCGLALLVMLSMALGRIRQNHPELLRSLVRSA